MSYGCRHIVIATLGSRGAVVYVDGKIYEQSSCLIKAVDTMAAGDSFIASFLIHYLEGMKDVREFPANSGKNGVTTISEYKDFCVKSRQQFLHHSNAKEKDLSDMVRNFEPEITIQEDE